MNHTEAIKRVMKDTGFRQIDLAEQIDAKTQTVISERINHANISVRAMLELLDAMGYEIVVRESNGECKEREHPIRLADYQE